jgi:hypothetical protein
MSQKPLPTVVEKQGKRNVIYRDAKGKTYSGYMTARASATQGTFSVWYGGKRVVKTSKNVASTSPKQTDVVFFRTGH